MRYDDKEYYLRRAHEERERAAVCENNSVALVHLELAEQYQRKALSCDSVDMNSDNGRRYREREMRILQFPYLRN